MIQGLARRMLLVLHIGAAVGWLGAVCCFVAIAVVGLASSAEVTVRGCYLAMGLVAWLIILPLSVLALLTGLIQALATPWGLFRHYWILFKFVLTSLSLAGLLIHLWPTSELATAAQAGTVLADLHKVRIQLLVASSAASILLAINLTLGVVKPRGLTRYGWRRLRGNSNRDA